MVWRGTPLASPHLVTIIVANPGNREIEDTDYLRPLTFSIPDAKIVNVETVDVSGPVAAELVYEYDEHSLGVADLIMNEGDSFAMQLLVDGEHTDSLTADCRLRAETRPIILVHTVSGIDPVGLYEILGAALPWPIGDFFRRSAIIVNYMRSPKGSRHPEG